jgi:hypothetical protein
MKQRKLRIGIIVLLAAIWAGFFTTDLIRCENEKPPIFCVETEEDAEWIGLLYKVNYNRWINTVCEPDDVQVGGGLCSHEKWEMSTWFANPSYE